MDIVWRLYLYVRDKAAMGIAKKRRNNTTISSVVQTQEVTFINWSSSNEKNDA